MPGEKPNSQDDILQYLAQYGSQAEIRRAKLVMLYQQDFPTRVIAERVGLSPSRVRYWLREYRAKGLSIFPAELTEASLEGAAKTGDNALGDPLITEKIESMPAPAETQMPEMLVTDLCDLHQVDMSHARFVADLTLTLFDITQPIHQLSSDRRTLAEIAGTLHNVGITSDPDKHDTVGRDILLNTNLIGFDDTDRRILAFSTALHRKKHKPKRFEGAINATSLPPEALADAKTITSLVRIADGLDYSGDQSTKLKAIEVEPDGIIVTIEGPSSAENASRALHKSDLWKAFFEIPFEIEVDGKRITAADSSSTQQSGAGKTRKMKSPGILSNDRMSEAGRKTLRFHFLKMLENEPGTRLGEDIEALHDMRVATRRMRSAIPIFSPYFNKRVIKRFNKDLRRTGRALGRVRDLDVFMEKAQAYLEGGEEPDAAALNPLINSWNEEREGARTTMLDYLESDRYKQFVHDFGQFVETEGAGAVDREANRPSSHIVFQAVPLLIYRRDSVVRGYAHVIQDAPLDTLHSLRIDVKRFRYALEFFQEVLGEGAKPLIQHAVKVQDHLGDLNDADVACQILIEFLDQWREIERRDRVNISGVTNYLVNKQNELRQLVATFPLAWEEFNSPGVRSLLAQAVSSL
jgi:CHAD domain-containing protein/DNA-binding Lrp family transcriptional regulator